MTSGQPTASDPPPDLRDEPLKDRILTLPNILCLIRLFGALVLLGFAFAGWSVWFVALFLFLSLTDLVDGTLARWLHQRSDFGARLDSVADITLISVLICGACLLCWNQLQHEWAWIGMGVVSYLVAVNAGLWKFQRIPSYHTLGAKLGYGLTLIAGISLLLDWSIWPLRIVAVAVTLFNLESIAITCVLKEWQTDVLTFFHVWPSPSVGCRTAPRSPARGSSKP